MAFEENKLPLMRCGGESRFNSLGHFCCHPLAKLPWIVGRKRWVSNSSVIFFNEFSFYSVSKIQNEEKAKFLVAMNQLIISIMPITLLIPAISMHDHPSSSSFPAFPLENSVLAEPRVDCGVETISVHSKFLDFYKQNFSQGLDPNRAAISRSSLHWRWIRKSGMRT